MSIFKVTAGPLEGPSDPGPLPAPVTAPRRIREGTAQQEALWTELVEGSGYVMAEARAGAGKSSSCREGMWRVLDRRPDTRITYTVFNKQNADEFRAECPPGVDVGTCHSIGLAALRKAFGCHVEKNKTYLILDEGDGKDLPRYLRKSVSQLVGQAKNQAVVPSQPDLREVLHELLLHYDVNAYGQPGRVVDQAARALARSLEWVELVDFDDMVWLPGLLTEALAFPPCDLLFIDEAQDWNPAQHVMAGLLAPRGRTVVVGDRYQAIYAFRGADPDSIPRLDAALSALPCGLTRLPLTLTFRCPRKHVALARGYVADIEAHASNPEGEVDACRTEDGLPPEEKVRPGDMVLCPKNAPLVRGALRLVGHRRKVIVRGRAIGEQLLSIARGCGECRTVADLTAGTRRWESRELSRLSKLEGVDGLRESVQDRAAGLLAVLQTCDSPGDVQPAIDALFSDATPAESIVFSTIHRAKGLEAARVWLISTSRPPARTEWEVRQRRNLQYVGLTRSKGFLGFVDSPTVVTR